MTRKVAVLVGSLRKESFNRKIAKALAKQTEGRLGLDIVPIGDLPFYNEDVEKEGAPAAWTAFRDRVRGADAVLFVTPEYNRSVPAALKNAIDVGSRPYGKSVWDGKPAAVISSTPGTTGAFGANHHLRQSLVFLNMPALQQPEMYLGQVHNWFDENGEVKDESAKKLLATFADAFTAWIEKHAR